MSTRKRREKTAGYVPFRAALAALAPALLMGLCGCLNPVMWLEPTEPDVNSAPVFIEDRVLPRPSREPVVAYIDDNCAHAKFSATVLDYDGDPEIYTKWIMHGDLGDSEQGGVRTRVLKSETVLPTQANIEQLLGADVPGALVYRDLELQLDKQALTAFDFPDQLRDNERTHLLELYVSDHRFGDGTVNVTPVQRPGEPRPLVAYASWLVRIPADNVPCQ